MMPAMRLEYPVLVLNGAVEWTADLAGLVRRASPLFAADGGANALARLGLMPDTVIGDLDSISSGVRAWIGEDRIVRRSDQSTTDFEKALDVIFRERGHSRLTVLAASGGRIDHGIGNLAVLAREARGVDLLLRSDRQQLIATSEPLDLDAVPGETWSFWSFDDDTRLSLRGVQWPLERRPIHVVRHASVSNVAVDHRIRIEPHDGTVVACRHFGTP